MGEEVLKIGRDEMVLAIRNMSRTMMVHDARVMIDISTTFFFSSVVF